MSDLSNDLSKPSYEFFGHSQTLNPIEPLPCDRWLALSAMQKSIRRGDGLTAQRALTTLYQMIRARMAAIADHRLSRTSESARSAPWS